MAPRYEDSAEQIRKAAPRYLRRAQTAGARSVCLEDVVGELNLAWTIARDKFDPNLGVPFAAYLQRGMQNHINRWIDEQIGFAQVAPVALDRQATGNDGADGIEIHELIRDEAPSPELELEEKDMWARAMSELSPEAAMFLTLLREPPAALYEEMEAISARAKHARSRGIVATAPTSITGNLVLDLMGIERVGRNRIYGEVKALAEILSLEVIQ